MKNYHHQVHLIVSVKREFQHHENHQKQMKQKTKNMKKK